ncbi:MAG: PQQ-dependent sugar dehydrogenase [Verrucomicrobiota bacterium]|nr:PQQ-dependent sugar dehydrogenase [Verrucomicrobiota bacterium]
MLKLLRGIGCGIFLALHLFTPPTSVAALPQVTLREVFPALNVDRPMWMVEAPDGSDRLFILEQPGRILIVRKGGDGADAQEFLNIVDRKPYDSNAEGLLGLAFHPQFRTNGLFYVYYNQQNPRRGVMSEFRAAAGDTNRADLATERLLLQVPLSSTSNHGGQVSFGPDGFLYLALGEGSGGNDPQNSGQNSASLLAKILRLDVNTHAVTGSGATRKELPYGIPTDNPFAGEPDKRGVCKEIWALGLRNVWRYSWDRETGEMWAGDVGQDDWEEVDLIVKGGNYGWCVREAGHAFKPGPEGARYLEAVIEYPHRPDQMAQAHFPTHSIGLSVTGGYVYRGRQFPPLRGVYVYADFTLGTIWGLRYRDGKVTEQGTLLSQPKNVVSFAEDHDGELYALMLDGKIYQVTAP